MIKPSIVIATADRPGYLLDCLGALKAVGVPDTIELVVVDAGVDSPVAAAVVQGVWPAAQIVKSTVRNAGLQRNLGVKTAHGEIIIFLDDDALVQPGWWPRIIEPLAGAGEWGVESSKLKVQSQKGMRKGDVVSCPVDPLSSERPAGALLSPSTTQQPNNLTTPSHTLAAVAGAVWCNPAPEFTDQRGGYVNWRGEPIQITHRSERVPVEVDWPMTTNMAIRKDVFCAIGGFPAAYGIYDEDVDLGLKIRRAGYRIRFVAQAAVYHTYLLRPRPPVTKATEFRAGRNRAMLLVRNYGFSMRLVMFCLTAPWLAVGKAVVKMGRCMVQAVGHLGAYLVGMVMGIIDGLRNPVGKDKEQL